MVNQVMVYVFIISLLMVVNRSVMTNDPLMGNTMVNDDILMRDPAVNEASQQG